MPRTTAPFSIAVSTEWLDLRADRRDPDQHVHLRRPDACLEPPPPEPPDPKDYAAEWERLLSLLPLLDPYHADTFELYYVRKVSQHQIARMFGISQAAVSYNLAAAKRKLRFLLTWPIATKTPADAREELKYVLTPQRLEIVALWLETKNLTEVARRLGDNQSTERVRLLNSIAEIKYAATLNPIYEPWAVGLQQLFDLRQWSAPKVREAWRRKKAAACSEPPPSTDYVIPRL